MTHVPRSFQGLWRSATCRTGDDVKTDFVQPPRSIPFFSRPSIMVLTYELATGCYLPSASPLCWSAISPGSTRASAEHGEGSDLPATGAPAPRVSLADVGSIVVHHTIASQWRKMTDPIEARRMERRQSHRRPRLTHHQQGARPKYCPGPTSSGPPRVTLSRKRAYKWTPRTRGPVRWSTTMPA